MSHLLESTSRPILEWAHDEIPEANKAPIERIFMRIQDFREYKGLFVRLIKAQSNTRHQGRGCWFCEDAISHEQSHRASLMRQ